MLNLVPCRFLDQRREIMNLSWWTFFEKSSWTEWFYSDFWRNKITWIIFKKKLVFLAEFIIDSVARPFQKLAFEVKYITMAFETSNIEYIKVIQKYATRQDCWVLKASEIGTQHTFTGWFKSRFAYLKICISARMSVRPKCVWET